MPNVFGSVFGTATGATTVVVTVTVTATPTYGTDDWDTSLLQTDLASIASAAGTGGRFLSGGVTYLGIFSQTDAVYAMRNAGFSDEASLIAVFDRQQGFTPAVNATIYRTFDSTTYRILNVRPDEAGWECDLGKPR